MTQNEDDRGNMITMIFDEKGKLSAHLIKPEDTYSWSDQFFTSDEKKMYWAVYDYSTLNKLENEMGKMFSKEVPNMVAANLHVVEVNLTNNTASDVTCIGCGQVAISEKSPVLVNSDKEMVFLGRTLDKKAKDSELVLVKIAK